MNVQIALRVAAAVLVLAASGHAVAQTRSTTVRTDERSWTGRLPWGEPDLQGEWTSEGEYGVPLERPAQFGTRAVPDRTRNMRSGSMTFACATSAISHGSTCSSGRVEGANAPIPHWREYNTTSRRTSLIVEPADGRLPPRVSQARPAPVQRCGSLQRGEPCDSYVDYGLGVRCIVHGGGLPDAMFPAVYNANMRIVQSPGLVAITYELIHDTRIIPIDDATSRALLSPAIRMYLGAARGRWEGSTLVVETTNLKVGTRGASPGLRLVERFTRSARNHIDYRVTFDDPATWTAPWTAALDLAARPDDAGVFEYACHEGNYGMANMLSTSRFLERTGGGK